MGIIIGMLVKNEANRWLKECLNALRPYDRIIVLDDCSEDDTVRICREFGAEVHLSMTSLWGENEFRQRYRLLELCLEKAKSGDFIGIIDADEILDGPPIFIDNIQPEIGYIGLNLYDMWSLTHYRDDEYWSAHKRYWPLFVRADRKLLDWENGSRLHCGRFPLIDSWKMAISAGTKVKHMGWSTQKDRYKKFMRYMRIDGGGIYGVFEQYLSIMDPAANLMPYPKGVSGQ